MQFLSVVNNSFQIVLSHFFSCKAIYLSHYILFPPATSSACGFSYQIHADGGQNPPFFLSCFHSSHISSSNPAVISNSASLKLNLFSFFLLLLCLPSFLPSFSSPLSLGSPRPNFGELFHYSRYAFYS